MYYITLNFSIFIMSYRRFLFNLILSIIAFFVIFCLCFVVYSIYSVV